MIDVIGHHAVKVLLRITVGIFENAVVHTHWKRGDIAGGYGYLDATIEGSNVCSLKTTAATPGDADALGINFRTGQKVINSPNAIPNFPAGEIGSGEIREVPEHGVLGAD